LQAGQRCPHCGAGWLVVIRVLQRHHRAPPCATAPSSGLPRPASAGPRLPPTAALYHRCARLPHTMAGTPLSPRPVSLATPPLSGPSPLCPPLWITTTPLITSRIGFPRDAGCLTIPYKLARRCRSTLIEALSPCERPLQRVLSAFSAT